MIIYLIRHTKVAVSSGVCYGQSDVGLADSYAHEKKQLLQKFSHSPDLIYSSPLVRCQRLAQDLQTHFDLPNEKLFLDNRLKEMSFGDWEMKKWKEIEEQALRQWTDNFVTAFTPNGESFEKLVERSIDFWQQMLLAQHNQSNVIAIVCHAGVIRSFLCNVLSIPLQKAFSLSIDYASLSKLRLYNTHVQVEFVNY